MRNFEQRKAEIFRRSEERIKKRKKARRVAAVCIPLVLCISAVAVFPWKGVSQPAQEHTAAMGSNRPGSSLYSESQTAMEDTFYGVQTDQQLTVQLRCGGTVTAEKSGETAEKILQLLEDVTVSVNSESKTTGDHYTTRSEASDETESQKVILTVTDAAGILWEYLWEDGLLTDRQTGAVYQLTVVQQKKLETLLA